MYINGRKEGYMSQENRRVQMTKRLITDAMTELCERGEPVAKISVSELCAIAEVNRSTFYKYYDGPEDLFGEIEEKFFSELSAFMVPNVNADIATGMREMCSYISQNKRIARIVINNNINPNFPEKLFSLPVLQNSARIFLTQRFGNSIDEKMLKYIYLFFVYGGYNLMRVWLNGGDESYEEIADTIVTLLNSFGTR